MPRIIAGFVYMNRCHHCEILKPEWSRMKQRFANYCRPPNCNSPSFVEFEASQVQNGQFKNFYRQYLQNPYDKIPIDGYPTIFKIVGGKYHIYHGRRLAANIESWVLGRNLLTNLTKKFRNQFRPRNNNNNQTRQRPRVKDIYRKNKSRFNYYKNKLRNKADFRNYRGATARGRYPPQQNYTTRRRY